MPASQINDGYKSEKSWRHALMIAVNQRTKGTGKPKRLAVIAEKCVKLAMKGESWAIKEIGDRMDGKPAQAIAIKGDPDSPVIFNLRLADGMVRGGQVELTAVPDVLTAPLVATVTQDEES